MVRNKNTQMQMIVMNVESFIPENHLLRKINNCIDFDFIYDLAAPYYSAFWRKSIDPVSLIKMLLVGFLYGIKSERRLVEEVSLGRVPTIRMGIFASLIFRNFRSVSEDIAASTSSERDEKWRNNQPRR